MWARYEKDTRRLRQWSYEPFSTRPGSDEADQAFPDGTTLPADKVRLRLTANLSGFELDPVGESQRSRANIIDALGKLDLKMPRVTEDVLDALIAKGVLALTDLPLSTNQIITNRKATRAQLI